jgi:phosphoribosylamine--glycine ligase
VPRNYPNKTPDGEQIDVPEIDRYALDLKWYWAACKQKDEGKDIYLTSSRSGAFVGLGDTLEQAEAIAERAASEVENGNPVRHRADIGRADVIDARISHMESIRSTVQLGTHG